mmetsp:Transcript_23800/g.53696  ORF Transcript_23800/g.53696 Transcript_23800/m.53696 type:complete len:164 (+) Transcript_23800:1715-2206(+)
MHKAVKSGKECKLSTKSGESTVEKAKLALEAAKAKVERAKTPEEKIAATSALEAARELQREGRAQVAGNSHLFSKTPSEDQVKKRVSTWVEKIQKLEVEIRNKDDNKEVSLGTSKINYCDPRISVAWCKRSEVPIDRVFPKTLRDKFVWAMFVPPDWTFEAEN